MLSFVNAHSPSKSWMRTVGWLSAGMVKNVQLLCTVGMAVFQGINLVKTSPAVVSIPSVSRQTSTWEQHPTLFLVLVTTIHDTWSTLSYHSVWSCPCIYCLFHCMYLCFLIDSILLVLSLISECFVHSVSPYNYLICFHLQFQLLTVPIPIYLLIWYALGIQSHTSLSLLIMLCKLCSSLLISIPDPLSITLYIPL